MRKFPQEWIMFIQRRFCKPRRSNLRSNHTTSISLASYVDLEKLASPLLFLIGFAIAQQNLTHSLARCACLLYMAAAYEYGREGRHGGTPTRRTKKRRAAAGGNHGCQMAIARFLDCLCLALRASIAPPCTSTLAQSQERKESNFAVWQPWRQ